MKIFTQAGHVQDEALLLLEGGELDGTSARAASLHLETCHACQARQETLREADACLRRVASPMPGQNAARVRLQDALSASTTQVKPWRVSLLRPALLLRLGAVAALLIISVTYRQAERPLQRLMAAYENTGPEPDHTLTPGATNLVTVAEVCRLSDENLDPELSPAQQSAVFHAYRMDEHLAKAYQVDYLINPQLGGNDQPANLWPEPYHATVWNAVAKDALETRLHSLVCSGQLDLLTAQCDLATDWIAAYKKYFHASRPVGITAVSTARIVQLEQDF